VNPIRHHLSASCQCCAQPFTATATATGVSRRRLLGAVAATLATSAVPARLFAQAKPHRIDVHHHIVPPTWLAAMDIIGRRDFPLSNWSVQKSLEDMDKGGVATAVSSITLPQVTPLGKPAGLRITRESNDYAAKLAGDHPGRFGVFAMLPLPHVDESLKEIAYVFDALKVDGVGLMTSYGNKWLGDPSFAPVWDELNRRKATVYTHPSSPSCCTGLVAGVPDYIVEYGTDTARTIASLILSGTSQKYPDINWIWSHGGGGLTAFAERFLVQVVSVPPYKDKLTRETVARELNRFHYDTAQITGSVALAALARLIPVSQIVYGTDFPYSGAPHHTQGVTTFFKGEDLNKVERENALRLLPRLKST
jgi:predicted TIM-barrel fold metal-dependent hydrolase